MLLLFLLITGGCTSTNDFINQEQKRHRLQLQSRIEHLEDRLKHDIAYLENRLNVIDTAIERHDEKCGEDILQVTQAVNRLHEDLQLKED